MKILSNAVYVSNDEKHNDEMRKIMMRWEFVIKLLLTNTQFQIVVAFGNGLSANMILSRNQLHKIGQSGGFLGVIT